MPGPNEASHNINSYLGPLVAELEEAWNTGFRVMSSQQVPITIRLALTCVACDIPASRKVSGFLGHTASLGCNKCLKRFNVSIGQSSDYSGYDRENWTLRNGQTHRRDVEEVLMENTKTGRAAAESRFGVRYSILLRLPYFDPVRFTAIDVMHNCKRMFELWLANSFLDIEELQHRISLFKVPAGVGRLPGRIGSRYGGFTAKQWKNWILLYSVVALKGMLPNDHMGYWLLYVNACKLLCKPTLKKEDIITADRFFFQFCCRFEILYGKEQCTPNMHLHLHLKECFLDFGPPHAFWCFAFERYNGILGSYHTNKRAVECQFMKKFLINQSMHQLLLNGNSFLMEFFPMKSMTDYESHGSNISEFCCTPAQSIDIINLPINDIRRIKCFSKNALI